MVVKDMTDQRQKMLDLLKIRKLKVENIKPLPVDKNGNHIFSKWSQYPNPRQAIFDKDSFKGTAVEYMKWYDNGHFKLHNSEYDVRNDTYILRITQELK